MKIGKLIGSSLWHYRRTTWTVFLGVVVAVAVLTGALMVGDSVKHSLRRITGQRLGKIRLALVPGDRLFRQDLAGELGMRSRLHVVPFFNTTGIAISNEKGTRINRVDISGINESFAGLWEKSGTIPRQGEAVLSLNTAARLGVDTGDMILLRIESRGKISGNAPFVPDRQDPVALNLRIAALVTDEEYGRFSLGTEQTAPLNVFVNLGELTDRIGLHGLANGMLVTGDDGPGPTPAMLDSITTQIWQAEDAGILIQPLLPAEQTKKRTRRITGEGSRYQLTSEQIFISDNQAAVIRQVIVESTPILTFMVNSIISNNRLTPYSFVTAADSGLLPVPPERGEIVINEWLASDLQAHPGDSVTLTYWILGPMRTLKEESARFMVKDVVAVNEVFAGQKLMPAFPGISQAGHCRDWETGSPVDLSKIRTRDEDYWKQYRGTPKAFISLADGQRLWGNPFGSLTAFRFDSEPDRIPVLKERMMKRLSPMQNGIVFRPVYQEGMAAATHSTDFGQLFLGLGFFIITAALILTGMLFSMHLSGRMEEAGLMLAIGIRRPVVLRILLGEALLIAGTGSVVGAIAGIGINELLLVGLNTLWYGAVQTSSLVAKVLPGTLLTGALSGIFIATAVMAFTIGIHKRLPVAWLLKGIPKVPVHTGMRRPRKLAAIILLAIGTMAILVTGANRKNTTAETQKESGTGGFLIWMETTLPVLQEMNSKDAQAVMNLAGEPVLDHVRFIPLQVKAGDDASCLNLNQVSNPPLMAIPARLFDSLGVMTFNALAPGIDLAHPWTGLEVSNGNGVINGFADMTVITWGLQKKIGDTLQFMDEHGDKLLVKLAGGLENSIFQGNLLISDIFFRKAFPSVSGAKTFLAYHDIPASAGEKGFNGPTQVRLDSLAAVLENALRDYGLMTLPATDRLAAFNTVENTYLTVFMMLGGLGLIIGTIGLGIILRRDIQERRGQLAMMRAIGYSKRLIRRILFLEYLKIMAAGMVAGIVPSVAILLPRMLQPGFQLPILWMSIIILLVLLSGLTWIWHALHGALKGEIILSLRQE